MENWQILAGINALLMAALGWFVKRELGKLDKIIDGKLDSFICEERHERTEHSCSTLFRHKHAQTYPNGQGGEVIIPAGGEGR